MYEQFKKLLDREGLKTSDVCKETGIDPSTFSHWKKGDYTPKRETLQKIAEYFSVPIAYFYEVEHKETFENVISKAIFKVAAGAGCYNESKADKEKEDDDMNDCSYVEVHGDSMYPDIHDGDILTVHHQYETMPTDYTVVKVDSEHATVKFVEKTNNGVWLRAINKEVYEDRFFSVQEIMTLPVTIIGKVIKIERNL